MESRKEGVFIKTADTSLEVMLPCLTQLLYCYDIKEVDSISCDKESKGFRVHFTKAEDSKKFENGLRFEKGSLQTEQARVRSFTRSSGEAGSLETTKPAAKRNGGKDIQNFRNKKHKTAEDDVRGNNKQRNLSDFFGEKKKGKLCILIFSNF